MEIYSDENNKGWELVFSMFARRDYRDFFLLSLYQCGVITVIIVHPPDPIMCFLTDS